jgi:lysophospholipase L1-like esterase
VPELLDLVLLAADLLDLTADPDASATGFVLESTQDPKRGASATLIIRDGSLSFGGFVVAGDAYAPIRFIENFLGKRVETAGAAEPVRILAIGDSITQGGKTFVTYRLPLDQKMRAAGLKYEFTGSQQSDGPNGPLWHEGYGGKNAEFLAGIMPQKLKLAKPDIILLHCGHNHSAEEKPVVGIIAAERTIIEAARKQNPKVVVLLAQVIPSGKLPKYSYLPELNQAEIVLARELSRSDAPVMIVDLATGFDPQKDTILDKVHPNAQGAEKMANKWFLALKTWMK